MPFIAPHTPLEAPEDLLIKYANLKDLRKPTRSASTDRIRSLSMTPSARPIYAAVVDALDQAIGQVLATLESEGIDEETIILFSSDNGGATYGGGGGDNYPLRGGKGETYEGGIKVIAALRWKGHIAPQTNFSSIMTMMDVFPTLAGATNIPMMNTKKIWGRDMWSAIHGSETIPLTKEVFFASETPNYGQFHTTVFNEQWKLVQVISSSLMEVNVNNQLFNIDDDPNEYNNLAADYPKLVELMAGKIRKWRALHPISGIRAQLVPPPGWRAPKTGQVTPFQ
jgi:arylsulfatase A-like enzyme